MPDTLNDQSVVPTATTVDKPVKPAAGPKYTDDANLLEEDEELVEEDETSDDEEAEKDIAEDEAEESDEEELDEEPSEDEKPAIAFDRPTVSEIKTKYPNFFKDFPQMKESYFREIEFSKMFPTVEDAKEAFTDNEAFTVLSDSALAGDPAPILDSIIKTDTKAYELFSMSFLPALFKKDNAMYNQVVTPLFQNLVRAVYKDKDENVRNAALVLADYIFGDDIGEDIAKGTKSVAKNIQPTEEQNRLKEQRENNSTQAFRTSAGKVEASINKSLESMIIKSPGFDPNKVFSPSLRRMGAQEVMKEIKSRLISDQGHLAVMSARWKRAKANGYTTDDESKIISTYLARAKSLIPSAASKVSSAMLGTKQKAAGVKSDKAQVFRKQNNSGRDVGHNNGNTRKDYSKMSDMDILNE